MGTSSAGVSDGGSKAVTGKVVSEVAANSNGIEGDALDGDAVDPAKARDFRRCISQAKQTPGDKIDDSMIVPHKYGSRIASDPFPEVDGNSAGAVYRMRWR